MAARWSGTPQSARKRPAAAETAAAPTAATSAATPGRGDKRSAGASTRTGLLEAPRGSSLLTPEPAQKRRSVSRGGGGVHGGGGAGAAVQENGGGGGGGGGGAVGGATPTSVFTPGTNTAHLLLQLRRDWAQHHGQGPEQMQQQQMQMQMHQAQQQRFPDSSSGQGAQSHRGAPSAAGAAALSQDAVDLMQSCSYEVTPSAQDGGGGGGGGFCDHRARPAALNPGAAAASAAMAGGWAKGGGTKASRAAAARNSHDRRPVAPSSGCDNGRRGRVAGDGSSSGGQHLAAVTVAATATAAAAVAGASGLISADAVRARVGARDRALAVAAEDGDATIDESALGSVAWGGGPRAGAAPGGVPETPAISALEGCSCKKSMCLKLYCQCFAGQLVCSDSCKCENCYNSAEHGVERRAAVRELLCRSPHAFDAKFKTEVLAVGANGGGAATATRAVVHNTGCGCSKSACLKRYCECFNGGIACSDKCRCKDCKNTAKAVGARARARNMAAKASTANSSRVAAAAAAAVAGAGGGDGLLGTAQASGSFVVLTGRSAAAVAHQQQLGNREEGGNVNDKRGLPQTKGSSSNIDVGGGGGDGFTRLQSNGGCEGGSSSPTLRDVGAAAARSPLGVLQGVAMAGDDSGSSRGSTTRV